MAKKQRRKRVVRKQPQSIISDEITIPNHSGMLDAGKVHRTPTENLDPVNKKYVDTEVAGVIPVNHDAAAEVTPGTGASHSHVALNTTHRSSDGSDHTYINQDVRVLATPRFERLGLGVSPSATTYIPLQMEFVRANSFGGGYVKNLSGDGITRFQIGMNMTESTLGILFQYDNEDGRALALNRRATIGTMELLTTGGGLKVENDGSVNVKEKTKMTTIGGFAVKLTNKTGGNTVAGQVVCIYSTTAINDAFDTCAANALNPIGIVLDAGVSDGSEAWIVVNGIADVLMDAGGSARGDRIITSAAAGSADVNNTPSAADHFKEIGHCIENRTGAGLARAVIHFL